MKINRLFFKISKVIKIFFQLVKLFFQEIINGFRIGVGGFVIKRLVFLMLKQISDYKTSLRTNLYPYPFPKNPDMKKLQNTVFGLHKLLPPDNRFTYSILIPVYKPLDRYLKTALESALNQTAPHMEVLVGFDGPQPDRVYQVVRELEKQHSKRIKSFQLDRTTEGGGISATTNYLAKKATGNYILLMDHDDWIRPDLLYRYEQTLRLLPNPENIVLSCNEYKINENDCPIPDSGLKKPDRPVFPYIFVNLINHCLLVPKTLWNLVGGLRIECNGAQDYDLALRLDLAKADFYNVPCFLYAWRSHSQSTAQNSGQKDYVIQSGIRALTDYTKSKNLDWKIEEGLLPTIYRAVPQLKLKNCIHVIIPFRDQKKLTLQTVKSILSQQEINFKITAIDNKSEDLSIAKELELLGIEVITIEEPFNFSRLNNLAVERSTISDPDDLLLFLNNDVELKSNALLEMSRWMEQPQIGMVGCRLHFPNGFLQHGGIVIDEAQPVHSMNWTHVEACHPDDCLFLAKILRVTDCITGACAMIKRKTFLAVGGFDEIWYPIAYSDTNLAVKLKANGLHCFYTPYAEGIHHESMSRGLNNIEDYENSSWLNRNFVNEKLLKK